MLRRTSPPLAADPLLRLLAINMAGGAAAALVLVAGLYWLDVGGLHRLSAGSSQPWLPVAMLMAGFTITFASAAMGAAVMLLPKDRPSGDGGIRRSVPVAAPRLAPVPAARARHRPS